MNWHKTRFSILSVILLLFSIANTQALAEMKFNGFISVGGGSLIDDDDLDSYIGFDDNWNTDPDTTFALQVSANLTDKVRATGQFIAHGNNDYELEAEWAYVTYSVSDNWDVRVGRLRSPFFAYSDFLDVGYAYPWIRPPEQVYRFLFTTVEGVDSIYTTSLGDWDSVFQVYFGRLTDDTRIAGSSVPIDLESFTGVNWTLSNDWLTVRATWNQADTSIGTPDALLPLYDSLNQLGFGSVADALEVTDEQAAFWGIAALVDHNDWLISVEYTEILIEDQALFGDDQAWYLMVARRFGDFTIHATYQAQESDEDLDFVDVIPAGLAPALDGLRAVVIGTVGNSDDEVFALGIRYDFAASTAFKIELADIDLTGRDGMLLSFAIDVVF